MSDVTYNKIDAFLGVNKSETETLLQLGEASYMSNFLITDDQKLQKQYGYEHLNEKVNGKKVNGQWYGSLDGVNHHLFARDGKIYEITDGIETQIGTVVDNYPTTFFVTNNVVYILDGTEFYSWDGTTFKVVEGYVPTVFTAAPPWGGGTILEAMNYLTGKKKMKFSADGDYAIFQLPEYDIDSVDSVTVNGVSLTKDEDYTVDPTAGTITFVVKPTLGVNNVEVAWTKDDADLRKLITNCLYYGGSYYARFWLFGNPNHRNTRYCSGVTMAGISDPTFWPMYTDSNVGEYEITDIVTQYKQQIIFTSGDSSGASAWFSTSENYTDPNTGIIMPLFPVYPISAKVGNVAKGQVQILTNNPISIWKGVYQWVSTYVMDEKNAEWLSKRIQRDLDPLDLTKAITWDWDDKGLYLLCIGKKIWFYNYRVDAWYILDLPHEPTCFMTVEKKLYFGTTDGQIMRFDESLPTFDGEEIIATWDMGYSSFGADWMRKFIGQGFIGLLPLTSTHIDVYISTDRDASFKFIKRLKYALSSFDTWDFSGIDVEGYESIGFSFETNYSPQPKRIKFGAKKFAYGKIRLVCGGTDGATVLSITLPTRTGGLVKNR